MANSYVRLLPDSTKTIQDRHDYDISTLCTLSRNFIELTRIYDYFCTGKLESNELDFRSFLLGLHDSVETDRILTTLGVFSKSLEFNRFYSHLSDNALRNNKFFKNLDSSTQKKILKGEKAFFKKVETGRRRIDAHIEKGLYKLFSNHTHSFGLALHIRYVNEVDINFFSLFYLSVETVILYYAFILQSYIALRWRIGKNLTIEDKAFIKACATSNKIKEWIEMRNNANVNDR
jgi:hypothetical protein